MGLFDGKRFLIIGVANERSIAWSIAQALHREGAQLGFTFVNEAIEKRLLPLAESIGSRAVFRCNVQNDEELASVAESITSTWGSLDGVVHSVAYAEQEDLKNRFVETSRQGFQTALDVSAYSLIAVSRHLLPLMRSGGTILTLTYLGSQRVVSNYKVMGVAKAALEATVRYLAADLGPENIRVNAISAGPIKTLAAAGIPKFKELLSQFAEMAPLKRNVTTEDVANAALFYLSPMSGGITGECTYVDCGFNVMGI
jgi:enoyl-[acyl-carrier protein] reductase I